jgi:hypothetical protein
VASGGGALYTPFLPVVLVAAAFVAVASPEAPASRLNRTPAKTTGILVCMDVTSRKGSRTPIVPWLPCQAEVLPRPFGIACHRPRLFSEFHIREEILLQLSHNLGVTFSCRIDSCATPKFGGFTSVLVREARADFQHLIGTHHTEVAGPPYVQGVPKVLLQRVHAYPQVR